ncbi:hypothetical protein C5167_001498, partial [Papaver somniferum]
MKETGKGPPSSEEEDLKSLVLRDKDDKLTSEFGDDDEVVSFIKALFDAGVHRDGCNCTSCSNNVENHPLSIQQQQPLRINNNKNQNNPPSMINLLSEQRKLLKSKPQCNKILDWYKLSYLRSKIGIAVVLLPVLMHCGVLLNSLNTEIVRLEKLLFTVKRMVNGRIHTFFEGQEEEAKMKHLSVEVGSTGMCYLRILDTE